MSVVDAKALMNPRLGDHGQRYVLSGYAAKSYETADGRTIPAGKHVEFCFFGKSIDAPRSATRDDNPDDMRVAKFLKDIALIQLNLGLLRDIEITDRLTGESSKIKFEIDVVT